MLSRRWTLTISSLIFLLASAAPAMTGTVGAALTTPTFDVYSGPSTLPRVADAAEPSIGVNWNTGAVMFQAYTFTYRVTFNDSTTPPTATWASVKPPNSLFNLDPILFTDHVTGRTFAGGLDGPCSILSYTDNDGASWTPMSNSCTTGTIDHETIGSGPWVSGILSASTYSRAVYYCAQLSIAQCSVSNNGGLSFGPGVNVPCGYINPGLHGSVHVGPNGHAWLPFKDCGDKVGVAVSVNNGLTWAGKQITGADPPSDGFDPDVATTPSGWAWVGYADKNYAPSVALTKNNGTSWTVFSDVASAAGVKSITFPEMVAGDDGRAALVFLGSTGDGNPHASNFAGTWHLYVSYTFNGGGAWTTVKVSDDIVQKGWICAGGVSCSTGRNLLDFIDAQVDAKGRVVVAYADGCLATCETGTGASDASYATIARQTGGRTLFAAYD